jgi:hypothetical protein
VNRTPDPIRERDGLDIVLTILVSFIALGFAAIIGFFFEGLCDPTPTTFQRTSFYTLVVLILLEMLFAGWYRFDDY